MVTIYFKNVCAEYRIMIRRTCFRRYKQNCTTKTAWIVIAPVIGLIGVSLIPMSLLTVRIDDGTTLYCASENGVVERIMSLVGLPAILTISLATLVLLYLIHNRSKNSNNSASEKEVKIWISFTKARKKIGSWWKYRNKHNFFVYNGKF